MGKIIGELVDAHLQRALARDHDARVAALAIYAARGAIKRVNTLPDQNDYQTAVVKALLALEKVYEDPEGEYTTGKSEISALRKDIQAL